MTRIQDGPLDALAAELVIPAKTGFYIAKSELIVLANLTEGSLRVNERRRMLADVLKSPDSLERLSNLIEHIIALAEAHIERYDTLSAAFPAMAPHLKSWRARAEDTIEDLRGVQDELVP